MNIASDCTEGGYWLGTVWRYYQSSKLSDLKILECVTHVNPTAIPGETIFMYSVSFQIGVLTINIHSESIVNVGVEANSSFIVLVPCLGKSQGCPVKILGVLRSSDRHKPRRFPGKHESKHPTCSGYIRRLNNGAVTLRFQQENVKIRL